MVASSIPVSVPASALTPVPSPPSWSFRQGSLEKHYINSKAAATARRAAKKARSCGAG